MELLLTPPNAFTRRTATFPTGSVSGGQVIPANAASRLKGKEEPRGPKPAGLLSSRRSVGYLVTTPSGFDSAFPFDPGFGFANQEVTSSSVGIGSVSFFSAATSFRCFTRVSGV